MSEAVVWTPEKLAELPCHRNFRLRGVNMTRMETFADAAFAFAVTMLVISVEAVPQNYEEFAAALKSIPAFFASFLQTQKGHLRTHAEKCRTYLPTDICLQGIVTHFSSLRATFLSLQADIC